MCVLRCDRVSLICFLLLTARRFAQSFGRVLVMETTARGMQTGGGIPLSLQPVVSHPASGIPLSSL
jgi:hypothetical protein